MRHTRRRVGLALAGLVVVLGTVVGAGAGVVDATTESRGGPKGHDVYFIRHAEASPADGPLSVNGLAQAEALRVLLHDQRIASVDTSMLTRAFQTGAAVASDHDLRITADERINEVGFVAAAVPQIPTILSDWLNGRNRAEGYGGESFDQAAVRWQSWWHDYVGPQGRSGHVGRGRPRRPPAAHAPGDLLERHRSRVQPEPQPLQHRHHQGHHGEERQDHLLRVGRRAGPLGHRAAVGAGR